MTFRAGLVVGGQRQIGTGASAARSGPAKIDANILTAAAGTRKIG